MMNILRILVLVWACGVPLFGLLMARAMPFDRWAMNSAVYHYPATRRLYRLSMSMISLIWPAALALFLAVKVFAYLFRDAGIDDDDDPPNGDVPS